MYDYFFTFIGEMVNSVLLWSKGPDLLLDRRGHRSIVIQKSLYHIGGEGDRLQETMTLSHIDVVGNKILSRLSEGTRVAHLVFSYFIITKNHAADSEILLFQKWV